MKERLLKIWAKQMPTMTCKPGCRVCCENYAPSMTKWEWEQINHPGKFSQGEMIRHCPFLGESGCEIYARRPMICRMFGTVARDEIAAKELAVLLPAYCPQGCQPDSPLSLKAALTIHTSYEKLLWEEACKVIQSFLKWTRLRSHDEPLPPKFQWLQYLLSTPDGQRGLGLLKNLPGAQFPAEDMQKIAEAMA